MQGKLYYGYLQFKFGYLKVTTNNKSLLKISFENNAGEESKTSPLILEQTKNELIEYLNNQRKKFTINFLLNETEFKSKVLEKVLKIPYGKTTTYKDIAIALENPNAFRAVGLSNKMNPLPIIIPCHRVIGSDGGLTGYAGGLKLKEFLLKLEGAIK